MEPSGMPGPSSRVTGHGCSDRPTLEESGERAIRHRNYEVQAFATNGADHAFAEGVRLWRTHRCFQDPQAHRLKRAVNAFATVGFSTAHVPAFRRVGAGEHQ